VFVNKAWARRRGGETNKVRKQVKRIVKGIAW
jgi:hypothetical protein